MKKLRIGVVGLGRLGKVHAQNIAYKIPNAELTAACSIVPAELEYAKQELGVTDVYSDYREMLASADIDAVVIVLYVVMHIFLSKTALGRSIYCAGGNMEATRLSGINTANVLTFCYTMSGIMAALAGIVSVGRSGICNGANATQPYDTDAIAACIIGGASFTGGKGTMFGTMLGCLIISVLRNGFTLLSIDSAVQNIVLGLVIILAVLMDVIRAQMEAKRRRLAAAK